MEKTLLKTIKNEGERQTSKEPSILGKCWCNQEDIPSLQSIKIPYLTMHHEAHFMEHQRAQQPREIQTDKKHDSTRETPCFLLAENQM